MVQRTGLVVAAGVTVIGSRMMAPPMPEQLAGTTIGLSDLKGAFECQRLAVWVLLAWTVVCVAISVWLGVR